MNTMMLLASISNRALPVSQKQPSKRNQLIGAGVYFCAPVSVEYSSPYSLR